MAACANHRIICCLLWSFFATCAGCMTTVSSGKPIEMDATANGADATLGPGDVFEVRVYGEKELSQPYRVASDGTIDFPLIGNIRVGGLTPSETKLLLEKKLVEGEFLKKPQISILVNEFSSKKISVFGQVKKPGSFSYQEGMGVVEAISIAGGFTPMAKSENTMVTRMVDGKKQNFVVSVEEIGKGRERDFELRSGDIIFVPERIF